ncbi:MAG: TolC family protein [Candidatus Omnitrophica bacterium]|nr:TolC family protein [Candidatus Omnitrophota bacterium]
MRNKISLSFFILCILGVFCLSAFAQTSIDRIVADSLSLGKPYVLSLDEVSQIALRNNFDIQIARYDAEIAKTKKGEAQSIYDTVLTAEAAYRKDKSAKTSSFSGSRSVTNDYDVGINKKLPTGTTLSLDQTNNRTWTDSSYVTTNPSHDSSLGFTVSQDLGRNFFGIQDRGDIKVTQIDIQNLQYVSLGKIEQSLSDVQIDFWGLVLALDFVKIEKDMLVQAERLYLINKEKLADGLVEQPDFLASEANYKQRVADVWVAENSAKTRMNALKLGLNLTQDMSDIMPANDLILQEQESRIETSLINAFEHRRDYRQALNDVRMRNIKLSMKKNNAWPEINLSASMARNGLGDNFKESIENISREDHPDFLALLKVSVPLENRKAKSQLKKAELEKAQALVALKMTERTIMINVVDQVRLCNTLFAKAKQQKEIAELQSKKLQEQEKIFSYGRSDVDTIIRYQQDALVAEKQASQSLFDYQASLIDLKVQEGVLLQQYWQEGI